jgi:hypothetical protein
MFLQVLFIACIIAGDTRRIAVKRYNVSVGDPQAERLEEDAKAEDISVQELIRRIISEHYRKQGQGGRK